MVEPSKEPNEKKEITPEKKDPWEVARQEASAVERVENEKQHLAKEDKEKVEKQIRLEIERMQLNPILEDEAKKQANKIEFLGEQKKIEHLLIIAQEQGLAFAIRVAKEMNDPFLLDIFHDILAKEGFYKKFLKQ